jgi:thioredoxin reductase (NADPH)
VTEKETLEIAVVGAGPCGLAVGIAARSAGLEYAVFDKSFVASSIARFPTFMTFFSTAERLELANVPFLVAGEKPTRREALRYYQRLVQHFDLTVKQFEEVLDIRRAANGFRLDTQTFSGQEHSYNARNVVLSTGYFDRPNWLNVPGEQLPKVTHHYREGHEYFNQDCVVVGGGNSAVDAALELHRWGARVTIVHFESGLDAGVKPWVLPDITGRIKDGSINVRFCTRVIEIRPDSVVLRFEPSGECYELRNDRVLAMTGYTPDSVLLRRLGVNFDGATGIPEHDKETMETNVRGVFIAGVIAAGNAANKVFIENGRDHGQRIVNTVSQRVDTAPGRG